MALYVFLESEDHQTKNGRSHINFSDLTKKSVCLTVLWCRIDGTVIFYSWLKNRCRLLIVACCQHIGFINSIITVSNWLAVFACVSRFAACQKSRSVFNSRMMTQSWYIEMTTAKSCTAVQQKTKNVVDTKMALVTTVEFY